MNHRMTYEGIFSIQSQNVTVYVLIEAIIWIIKAHGNILVKKRLTLSTVQLSWSQLDHDLKLNCWVS